MHGKVKITKRQIKEDKFTTFMLTAKNQMSENWQFVAIGIVVVIMAISAIAYYNSSQESAQLDASERFARALMDYRNGEQQVAILGLTSIIEDYKGDPTAEQATFLLGKLNLTDRNYPEANRYYEMYLSTYKDNQLNRAASLAGIAIILENQGQYAEAAGKYVEAANQYVDGPLEGDYLVSAIRNFLETGDVSSARAKLDIIEDRYDRTDFMRRGQRLFYEKGSPQAGS